MSKVTSKLQITLPKRIAEQFGLHYVHNADFDPERSAAVWEKYLKLAPNAWDAKFLRRELKQDGQ